MSKLSPRTGFKKYGNIKAVSADGNKFDSRWERTCYSNFNYMKLANELKEIQCQVRYKIEIGGITICTYVADFVIVWNDDSRVVYDAKGAITKDFAIKMKLMKAIFGIDIVLLKKDDNSNYPWLYARKF